MRPLAREKELRGSSFSAFGRYELGSKTQPRRRSSMAPASGQDFPCILLFELSFEPSASRCFAIVKRAWQEIGRANGVQRSIMSYPL